MAPDVKCGARRCLRGKLIDAERRLAVLQPSSLVHSTAQHLEPSCHSCGRAIVFRSVVKERGKCEACVRVARNGGGRGLRQGFDMELVKAVVGAVTIPVIASSGAGCSAHFSEVLLRTDASAALAAGIFHRGEVAILDVKRHMHDSGVPTRLQ